MHYVIKLISSLLFCCLLLSGCATTTAEGIQASPQVQAFIDEMVVKHQFNREQLQQLFAKVEYQPRIIQLMQTPHEAKPWYIYKTTFVTEARAKAGVKFWKEHQQLLEQVEREYGIPASIIVAILGVETYYGPMQGNIRVLDSLATLAFNYPPRAPFFKSELEHFLIMIRDAKVNPEQFVGSYAGAFGKAQFMPSSYRHYAVAFHHTGFSDLVNSDADVIASIANYFKMNGWHVREAIAAPAKVSGANYLALAGQDMKPTRTIAAWKQLGVTANLSLPLSQPAALLKLQQQQGVEYWLGLHNFYVLSRYNPRLNYAMAVYQLSLKISKMHGKV